MRSLAETCQFAHTSGDGKQGGANFVKDLGIRPDSDCSKALAVHRLSLLGVVTDYTLDYRVALITVHLARKPASDEEYLSCLSQYLQRYTTLTKARELRDAVANRDKGNTVLEKCLGTMLDFTYETIVVKRKLSIEQMHDALRKYGVEKVEGLSLAEYCDLYLNSKYAEKQHLPTEQEAGLPDTAGTL